MILSSTRVLVLYSRLLYSEVIGTWFIRFRQVFPQCLNSLKQLLTYLLLAALTPENRFCLSLFHVLNAQFQQE